MTNTYGITVIRHVYCDLNNTKIKVGPHPEGIGFLEIDGGEEYGNLIVSPQHAKVLAKAIIKCAEEMEAGE